MCTYCSVCGRRVIMQMHVCMAYMAWFPFKEYLNGIHKLTKLSGNILPHMMMAENSQPRALSYGYLSSPWGDRAPWQNSFNWQCCLFCSGTYLSRRYKCKIMNKKAGLHSSVPCLQHHSLKWQRFFGLWKKVATAVACSKVSANNMWKCVCRDKFWHCGHCLGWCISPVQHSLSGMNNHTMVDKIPNKMGTIELAGIHGWELLLYFMQM